MKTNELKTGQRFPLRTLLWVTLFGIAFANIESAVVNLFTGYILPRGFFFSIESNKP